jgi:hypothetical protein
MGKLKPSYQELINYIENNVDNIEISVTDNISEFTAYKLGNQDYFLIILSDSDGYPYINFHCNSNDQLDYMFVDSADRCDFLNAILNKYYLTLNALGIKLNDDVNLKSKIAFELIEKSISNYCLINWDALDYEDKLIKQII